MSDVKLCECGCGQATNIATHTHRRRGVVKGQPYRFIQNHHLNVPARPAEPLGDCLRIPLTQNAACLVSPEDGDLAEFHWYEHTGGYATRKADRSHSIYMHRVILERMIGRPLQPGEGADHQDGNRLNNRRDNLRLATPQQNNQNAERRVGVAGYRGVRFDRSGNKWVAQITAGGKTHRLGRFATPEEASVAYERAAAEHFGEWKRSSDTGERETESAPPLQAGRLTAAVQAAGKAAYSDLWG